MSNGAQWAHAIRTNRGQRLPSGFCGQLRGLLGLAPWTIDVQCECTQTETVLVCLVLIDVNALEGRVVPEAALDFLSRHGFGGLSYHTPRPE